MPGTTWTSLSMAALTNSIGGLQRGEGYRLDRRMWDVYALLPLAECGHWATHGKSRLTLGESGGVAGGLELFSETHGRSTPLSISLAMDLTTF
jgi:hypothetical protein